jgi:hypothetical protein
VTLSCRRLVAADVRRRARDRCCIACSPVSCTSNPFVRMSCKTLTCRRQTTVRMTFGELVHASRRQQAPRRREGCLLSCARCNRFAWKAPLAVILTQVSLASAPTPRCLPFAQCRDMYVSRATRLAMRTPLRPRTLRCISTADAQPNFALAMNFVLSLFLQNFTRTFSKNHRTPSFNTRLSSKNLRTLDY